MNELWSRQIQGVQTLYGSRRLRFQDCFQPQWTACLGDRKSTRLNSSHLA